MTRYIAALLFVLILIGASLSATPASDWATEVVSFSNLETIYPYDDPSSALGRPTTLIKDTGFWPIPAGSIFHASMVYPAHNTAPDGSKLVVRVLSGGQLTVKFDSPVYDDPENWDNKDLIVFGNGGFAATGYAFPDTNMESLKISTGAGTWEQATVSVSQNGVDWFTYSAGPYVDEFAPTHMSAWNWIENTWGAELDYTKPIPPSLVKTDFASTPVASAIDLYKGSGGGMAYDISQWPLPVDATGRKWIQYVRIEGNSVELDAVTRVSHAVSPISVGAAKNLPDGARVILNEAVVSAGTYEVGRCCYVQDASSRSGIRVLGRVLNMGDKISIYGEMATVGGERVVKAVAVDPQQGAQPLPIGEAKVLAMSSKSFVSGLSTVGMLVKAWGEVKTVDEVSKSFIIDDGSGVPITCIGPRVTPAEGVAANPTNPGWGVAPDAAFALPGAGSFVSVIGISSRESGAPVVRLRNINDVNPIRP